MHLPAGVNGAPGAHGRDGMAGVPGVPGAHVSMLTCCHSIVKSSSVHVELLAGVDTDRLEQATAFPKPVRRQLGTYTCAGMRIETATPFSPSFAVMTAVRFVTGPCTRRCVRFGPITVR
jgi:hypothetical protein